MYLNLLTIESITNVYTANFAVFLNEGCDLGIVGDVGPILRRRANERQCQAGIIRLPS